MSPKKQSKRARFYAQQRTRRKTSRIIKANIGNPRFIGAISKMTISFGDGERRTFGFGGLFLVDGGQLSTEPIQHPA